MVRIEHVALYVRDLEGMKKFYEVYFGAVSNELYHNKSRGFQSYFLSFEGGARLELMTLPELEEKSSHHARTGFIHIAMSLGSKQRVDEMTQLLISEGYEVFSHPRTTGDGYYESCVLDPEGNLLELTV